MQDRRQAARFKINQHTHLHDPIARRNYDCRITDVSDTGARLLVSDMAVPDHFMLYLPTERRERRPCRVVWRLGYEIGAEFNDANKLGFAKRMASRDR